MNILFIDSFKSKDSKIFDFFGFNIKGIKNTNIYYLNFHNERICNKFTIKLLSLYLKHKFKGKKVYIVFSKYIEDNNLVKNILQENIKDITFVSNQNNLLNTDKIYIEDYIKKNNLSMDKVKVLVIIDSLEINEKRKIEEMVKMYKIVDIYTDKLDYKVTEFIQNINKQYGSVVETIDKLNQKEYNIILVFSKEGKDIQTKSSFILNYNNSDFDIKSNTYMLYKKNIERYNKIFFNLGMDLDRFEKTKLGKLYILASRILLDI